MFEGISTEMMENVIQGKSPLCALEKRIANGKMMAYNIGKTYGLLPEKADPKHYLKDDHKFWREQYLAQTGHHKSSAADLTDLAHFDWKSLGC